MGFEVAHPEAYSYLGEYILRCKESQKFKSAPIANDDDVRMLAYDIAEVAFNDIRAQEVACSEYFERIIKVKHLMLVQAIGHSTFKNYLKILNFR